MTRNSKPQSIRIIAGAWRGRRLPVLDRPMLRPTKDAVRETLFNWLAPVIQGARCLDLFAGTGALGFEAASRDAAAVVLVEKERSVARALTDNLGLLGAANRVVVHNTSAENFLSRSSDAFDLVFCDPPFAMPDFDKLVADLCRSVCLKRSGQLYIEADIDRGVPPLPHGWHYHRCKTMGRVVFALAVNTSEPR